MTRSILVTGAAGFIGSHLVDEGLARGWRVVGLDNLDTFYEPGSKLANLDRARGNENFEFIEGDIRDEEVLAKLFGREAFDAVAHLGAIPGVRQSIEDPLLYFDVNVRGTIALLQAVVAADPSPLVAFASSSSVYGKTQEVPFREDDPADTPLAPYPASKRTGELIGHAYHHVHGVDFTALRFFTVYGPRNRPDMMAYKLISAAQRGTSVRMHAGGTMERDFTYVGDIVAGIASALERRLGYEIVNLGAGSPTSLLQLKEKVEQATGRTIATEDAEAPPTDVDRTWADISKAERLLGYKPDVPLDEGVAAAVADLSD